MKVFATLQLFATLLSATDAADLVQGTRLLKSSMSKKQGRVSATFADIKLTPGNELFPFIGVEFASGTATVRLKSTKRDRKVCIETSVEGFIPGLLHIHKGTISGNGALVVDFSSMLSSTAPDFDGCVAVTNEVFDDIKLNPVSGRRGMQVNTIAKPRAHLHFYDRCSKDLYYVNAHVAAAPPDVKNLAIRGQLLQKFSLTVLPSVVADPFMGKEGASGVATIKFESAGTAICIDATIIGFDPALAHIHNAKAGSNGVLVVDFTSTKIAPGRFLGCISVPLTPGVDQPASIAIVESILGDPSDYFFFVHEGIEPDLTYYNGIRAQLDGV